MYRVLVLIGVVVGMSCVWRVEWMLFVLISMLYVMDLDVLFVNVMCVWLLGSI